MRDWAPTFVERRGAPRRAANNRVVLTVQNGMRRGCSVFDLSSRGARLQLGAPYPLPLRFEMRFTNGKSVRVHLVWQQELMAGVFFDTPLTFFEHILCGRSLPPPGDAAEL